MQSAPAAPFGREVAEPATGRVARTTRAAAAYQCEPFDKDRQREQPHACRSSRRGKQQAASAQELPTTAYPDRCIGKRNFRRHEPDSGVGGDEVGKAAKKEPGEQEQATSKSLTTRPFECRHGYVVHSGADHEEPGRGGACAPVRFRPCPQTPCPA